MCKEKTGKMRQVEVQREEVIDAAESKIGGLAAIKPRKRVIMEDSIPRVIIEPMMSHPACVRCNDNREF